MRVVAAARHHGREGQTGSMTCDSCGADEPELFAVHRRYVTLPDWDTPGRDVTLDEVEHWCYPCLTHYPHVPVDDTAG